MDSQGRGTTVQRGSSKILEILRGGDRRSIGRVPEVVTAVLANPGLLHDVFAGIMSEDPVTSMRCADATEKLSAKRPDLLQPFKRALLTTVAALDRQEVQWHVAQMIPRVKLNSRERATALTILDGYLASKSSIVKAASMQAMAELSEQDVSVRPRIMARLTELTETGTPAMKSRGRRLLTKLSGAG